MSMHHEVTWYGPPLVYLPTTGGIGVIIGSKHYRIAPDGQLQYLSWVTPFELRTVLQGRYGEQQAKMMYAVHTLPPTRSVVESAPPPPPAADGKG